MFCYRKIVLWRCQKKSQMTTKKFQTIIQSKKELKWIPIIANADFWHTNPLFTFPIWWKGKIIAKNGEVKIEILEH